MIRPGGERPSDIRRAADPGTHVIIGAGGETCNVVTSGYGTDSAASCHPIGCGVLFILEFDSALGTIAVLKGSYDGSRGKADACGRDCRYGNPPMGRRPRRTGSPANAVSVYRPYFESVFRPINQSYRR